MEGLQVHHLLPRGHKLDGLARGLAHGQGGAAPGVAIHLGQDDARHIQRLVEMAGDGDRLLPQGAIGHQEDFLGMDGLLQADQLLHQGFVNLEAPRRVQQDHLAALGLRRLDGLPGHLDDILAVPVGVDGEGEGLPQHLQLVDGGGARKVAGGQQGALLVLLEE